MFSSARTLTTDDGELGVHVAHPTVTARSPPCCSSTTGPASTPTPGRRWSGWRRPATWSSATDRYHRAGPWTVFDVEAIVTGGPDSPATGELMGLLLGTTEDMVASDVDDGLAPVDHNQPLLDAVAALGEPSGYGVYDGADHGFAVPGFTYHEPAADKAYDRALELLGRQLC
ncbi:MAG: hypothetical protein ACFCVK_25440 [Acidimicrobiales bacterium]